MIVSNYHGAIQYEKVLSVIPLPKLLACHGSLTYGQMESILKLHGYPKLNNVIKNYKVYILKYCS